MKIQLKAMKETMKLMNYRGKKRKAETSSSESEDDQEPILVEKTFKVKDNGHDILDFKIRNSLRTINAKPEDYYKNLVRKVEPRCTQSGGMITHLGSY